MKPLKLYYYIYLDTKIIGAAKQVTSFFMQGVFSVESCIVLIKKYRHKSNYQISKIFAEFGILARFVTLNDIDGLESGYVFYLFNAQSNCRVVANRRLKHIFVTHGESSKLASVKPILRIYDYVLTAGQAGIDRLIDSGIFSVYDRDIGKIIRVGDIFVGNTGLGSDRYLTSSVIFYAPTWEGGNQRENYSSLSYVDDLVLLLGKACKQHKVSTIVIKPHPNTGHRIFAYRKYLIDIAINLSKQKYRVVMFERNVDFSFRERMQLRIRNVILSPNLNDYYAVEGFCDISAVETQFLNENIRYRLLFSHEMFKTVNYRLIDKYKNEMLIDLDNYDGAYCANPEISNYRTLKEYVIDKGFVGIARSQQINNLISLYFSVSND